jgi:hypothetical protein
MNRRPDAVALDVAHALAEPLTGLGFDDLHEKQQDELLTAAWAAMATLLEKRPVDVS